MGWPRSLRSRGCSRYWSRFTSNGRGGVAGRGKRSRRSSVSADRRSIKSTATSRSESSDSGKEGGGRSLADFEQTMQLAARESERHGHSYLGTEHALLGLL